MRWLLVALGIALLALKGCAGASGPESARILAAGPKPGQAVVFIGRPYGWNVSHIPLSVELNDRALVQLGISTYSRVELPPGTYKIAAANTYMTRITYGTPRPLHLKVEAGKTYYVLPTRAVENERQELNVIGTTVVVGKTGDVFGGFAVRSASDGAAPPEFAKLSHVAPDIAAAGAP